MCRIHRAVARRTNAAYVSSSFFPPAGVLGQNRRLRRADYGILYFLTQLGRECKLVR